MRYFLLFVFSTLYMCMQGQPQGRAHFIEADRLAGEGNMETAFALLAGEVKQGSNCHALGYYWNWCLLFGEKVNDSTYEFQANRNQVFGKVFTHSFKSEQMLSVALKKCPNNGLLNKAQGYQNYIRALETENIEHEEEFMNSVVIHLRKALRGGTSDSITNFYLGQGLEYQSKYGEAIRYYKKTYQLNDAILQSLLKVAACYGKLSEWDSCYYYADFVLPLADAPLIRATAMRLKAESLAAKKQRKAAKKLFIKAMRVSPKDYDNHLAYIDFLYPSKKKKACKEAVRLLYNHTYHRHIYHAYAFIFDEKDRSIIFKKAVDGLPKEGKDANWIKSHMKVK